MNHSGNTFHLGIGVKKIDKYNSISTYNFYTKCNGKYNLYEVNAKNFKIVCTDKVKPKIVINATREVAKIERLKFIFNEDLLKDRIDLINKRVDENKKAAAQRKAAMLDKKV